MSSPERLVPIDVLKGVGIVSVVWIHASSGPAIGEPGLLERFLLQLTRFAVPAFLAASGYLYAARERVPGAVTRTRLRRVLLPYLLASALIREFPKEYAQYYSQKEFRYNNITQPNRNRLLWLDPSVDGVKTGYTETAGYCLIASSNRGGRRLLSVLLGSTSEAARAQESQKLLNWGFQFFDSVKLHPANQSVKAIEVWKGSDGEVKTGFKGDIVVTVPKGEAEKLKAELLTQQPLLAPVSEGQRVGTLRVTYDGKLLGEYPLVALETVAAAGLFGRAWDTLRLWIK